MLELGINRAHVTSVRQYLPAKNRAMEGMKKQEISTKLLPGSSKVLMCHGTGFADILSIHMAIYIWLGLGRGAEEAGSGEEERRRLCRGYHRNEPTICWQRDVSLSIESALSFNSPE